MKVLEGVFNPVLSGLVEGQSSCKAVSGSNFILLDSIDEKYEFHDLKLNAEKRLVEGSSKPYAQYRDSADQWHCTCQSAMYRGKCKHTDGTEVVIVEDVCQ